ncbi:hypothetical protein JST97_03825 [bacterium]|nr:hypothetical protein [bacterium]
MMTINTQQRHTPVLNYADANLQKRIAAGASQGNLTADEQAQLSSQMAQYNQDLAAFQAGGGDMTRKELWAEATQISHSIFDLRHNELGSMGPVHPHPGHEHESYRERMVEGWLKQKPAVVAGAYAMGGGWAAAAAQFRS